MAGKTAVSPPADAGTKKKGGKASGAEKKPVEKKAAAPAVPVEILTAADIGELRPFLPFLLDLSLLLPVELSSRRLREEAGP